ncbi:hypothetical protein [Umboniibacter marinipuniceus]|uniref:Uncharacterized protein n=1 Tax=Umboniibacter marinipuniceus TaxID=569599 RepID=A0A3M0AE02_9GAMM|nr:hypothetical protein [Umboniibacter marinipuniceus]RMA80988.1 hypothetical protein DFR27_0778 [Umboniibacter marinipuniceus]
MLKSASIISCILLVSVGCSHSSPNIRAEEVYIDREGYYHHCGIGEGLTRCDKEYDTAESNEDIDAEAEEIRAEEIEHFEETIERLEEEKEAKEGVPLP